MPTTKPRYAVTETTEVAAALESARRRWPEDRDRPARLLSRLIEEGRRRVDEDLGAERADRLVALRRISGSYSGLYGPGYLTDLRSEWPE